MKLRNEECINEINKILKRRMSSLAPLTSKTQLDVSPDLIDDYNDVLCDELMEFGIDDKDIINQYGISIDRLIGYMNAIKWRSVERN